MTKNKTVLINYPIGDYFIRIKNAYLANNHEFSVPKTKLILAVSKVLKKEGFIDEIKEVSNQLNIRLTYKNKKPVIMDIRLISKPGLRVYKRAKNLEKTKKPSIYIVSTPKGIFSSKEAIKKRLGGEIIAEIW